jgi:Family of unknown function (DUF5762)
MAEINQCPTFWVENPQVLISDATDFFPFSEDAKRCSTTALNSLTRFGVYLGILLFIITRQAFYLGIPVLAIVLTTSLYFGMKNQGTLRQGPFPGGALLEKPTFREGFANIEGSAASDKVVEDIIGQTVRTEPNEPNPFMNILINEIADYPTKPPAKFSASGPVKATLESQFQKKVYGDPGDVWNRNQGQREFYTMPSTSIPNDRESYQNWLYRVPGKTCKEGNTAACTTDGSNGSQYVMFG